MASQVTMRVLIQTGRPLGELTETDLVEFATAVGHRETVHGRSFKHYRVALHESRTVLYHLGAPVTAAVKRTVHLRWPWERHFLDVPTGVGKSLVAYLECAAGTRARSTVLGIAGRLAHFGTVHHHHRPDTDHAGRAGPATPHRALPGGGRRGPAPAHRSAAVRVAIDAAGS